MAKTKSNKTSIAELNEELEAAEAYEEKKQAEKEIPVPEGMASRVEVVRKEAPVFKEYPKLVYDNATLGRSLKVANPEEQKMAEEVGWKTADNWTEPEATE